MISPLYQHLFAADPTRFIAEPTTGTQQAIPRTAARFVPRPPARFEPGCGTASEQSTEPVQLGSLMAQLAIQYGLVAEFDAATGLRREEPVGVRAPEEFVEHAGSVDAVPAIVRMPPRAFELSAELSLMAAFT